MAVSDGTIVRANPMKVQVTASLSAFVLAFTFTPTARADEGHDAGYEWAEFNSIDDPARCYDMSGNAINSSPSFTEGCLQYLQDRGITNDTGEPRHHDDVDDHVIKDDG